MNRLILAMAFCAFIVPAFAADTPPKHDTAKGAVAGAAIGHEVGGGHAVAGAAAGAMIGHHEQNKADKKQKQ